MMRQSMLDPTRESRVFAQVLPVGRFAVASPVGIIGIVIWNKNLGLGRKSYTLQSPYL